MMYQSLRSMRYKKLKLKLTEKKNYNTSYTRRKSEKTERSINFKSTKYTFKTSEDEEIKIGRIEEGQ